jgi:CheY-like chemotaxis protein/HPt (histidine-containing phosphotransfer) domain-containing protein
MKVLVVDDSTTAQEILEEALESMTFDVSVAGSGKEALVALDRAMDAGKPYELVIMDWKMPGLDGIETSRRIKGNTKVSQVPTIIMVTAYGREEIMGQAEQVGLDGFLIKPVSTSVLFNTIMDVFGQQVEKRPARKKLDAPYLEALHKIRGARILLAEDNEINQQVAKEILESAGLVVDIVDNGKKAVDAVTRKEYDAVLMDIQMPEMGGYEATAEIRKGERFKALPIIAMTAHALAGDHEKSLESGMNDHVTKPIDPAQLFSALTKWIEPGEREVPEHLAAKPREKSEEKRLTDMPGISVNEGLNRVGGNSKLYNKILTTFYTDYSDITARIKEAMDADDQELAQRLAHTVKGVAGNIGAKDLAEATGQLEAAIKHEKTREWNPLLKGVSEALNLVMTSLKNVIDIEDETEKEKIKGKTEDPEKLLELLLKLEPHLTKRKPKPCKEVMEEINNLSWPDESAQEITELGRLIGKYKFKDAQVIQQSIIEKLKALSM